MSLHDIHSCSLICAENSDLKQKLLYIKRKKEEVQRQLDELLKEKKTELQKKSKPTTRETASQTDPKPWMTRQYTQPARPQGKGATEPDIAKVNKVIDMHSQLLKRYDKEVKLNMTYADNIADLNVRLAETERQLREEKEKNIQLERELMVAKKKMARAAEAEDPVLRDLVAERNKLAKENKRLRGELKGLDHNFFDEIEDLKYALLQSAKLNKEYEKSLQKICKQHGVPYPAPEKVLIERKGRTDTSATSGHKG